MFVIRIVFALLICLGCIISYIPQFHAIIKNNSVEGISEMCLILMNIAMFCLTTNSIIFSWEWFFCSTFDCYINFFPFIQIFISWLMVLIYYIIFITYKFRNRKKKKRIVHGLQYIMTYVLFSIFIIGLVLGEKLQGNLKFFQTFAKVLGYSSAVINCLVYLPQIYKIYQKKSKGNLSLLTYILQTPGNGIIILFQAVLYGSSISTWITYAIVFVQQLTILLLIIYYDYFYRNETTEDVYSIN